MPESSDLLTIHSLVEDIASHDTLDALENSKITVDDLLFSRGSSFAAMLRSIRGATPSNHSITSYEIETLRLHAAQKLSGRSTSARHELTAMQQQLSSQGPMRLLTGVTAIDGLLNGSGFVNHTLVEISGPKFSGKTALALQLVTRHLASYHDHSALWIDTSGGFAAERADSSVSYVLEQLGMDSSDTPRNSILERLQIQLCFELADLTSTLSSLEKSFAVMFPAPAYPGAALKHHTSPATVFDCRICPGLPSVLKDAPPLIMLSTGHASMTAAMHKLNGMAREHSLAVLALNDAVQNPSHNNDGFRYKPALGPSFTFLTDQTVWLSHAEQPSPRTEDPTVIMCQAELTRSRSKPRGSTCRFLICEGTKLKEIPVPSAVV